MGTVLRALAGLVLGTAVFAGLLYLLVVVNFSHRLVDSEVYEAAINETDAYNRVYDEVLVDEALEDYTSDLLGGVEVEVHADAVELLRQVMPPAYLQEQTEENIDRLTAYLRYEEEALEFFVDLKEPLERVEPSVQSRVERFIDDLEITDPPVSGCTDASLFRLAAESAVPFSELSDGKLPETAPSLKILNRECREREFDRWFDRVLDDPAMNSQAARILESEKASLRRSFVEGDTRGFLKQAAGPLVGPLVDDAVSDTRRELQRNDRLDLLEKLVENSDDLTREELDEQAETLRSTVRSANGTGRAIAMVIVILGILLLAAVHFPRPGDMLRWPGISLLMGGGVCLVVGFVVNSAVPDRIKDAITNAASYSPDVPVAAIDLAGDIFAAFARQVTAGFIPAAVTVMVVGAVLIVASLFAGAAWTVVRRFLHGDESDSRVR